jgi:hypothetical protein
MSMDNKIDIPAIRQRCEMAIRNTAVGAHLRDALDELEMQRQRADELLAALRELHDFAVVDSHFRHEERSLAAFAKAAELLERFGG